MHQVVDHQKQRVQGAINVDQPDGGAVFGKLPADQRFKELLKRSQSARQHKDAVGEFQESLAASSHGVMNLERVTITVGLLEIDEAFRGDSGEGSARLPASDGNLAHESDTAAAVHHTNAALCQRVPHASGRVMEGLGDAGGGTAIHGDTLHDAAGYRTAASRELAVGRPVGHDASMSLHVLLLTAASFLVGLVMTAALCRIGRRLNAMDSPGGSRRLKQLRDVPNIGGIAIAWPLIAVIGGTGVAAMVAPEFLMRLIPSLTPWADRLAATAPTAVALACGLLILHVMGLVDDRRNLSAWPRLGVQVAIAALLASLFDVRLLQQLDTLGLGITPSVLVTVVWIVVVTNAMNFLDNMDGLTAGVTVIAGGLFMVAALATQQWFVAATLAVLVGTTAGFLCFNLPPAKIFLGDGGSLVIGLTLAVLTVRTTYWEPDAGDTAWWGTLMPLAVLAVPLYDIVTVTTLRLVQGKSPLRGDHQHFSHRLVDRGLSRRRAVFVIWALAALTGAVGLMLPALAPWQAWVGAGQVVLVWVVLAVLETGASK